MLLRVLFTCNIHMLLDFFFVFFLIWSKLVWFYIIIVILIAFLKKKRFVLFQCVHFLHAVNSCTYVCDFPSAPVFNNSLIIPVNRHLHLYLLLKYIWVKKNTTGVFTDLLNMIPTLSLCYWQRVFVFIQNTNIQMFRRACQCSMMGGCSWGWECRAKQKQHGSFTPKLNWSRFLRTFLCITEKDMGIQKNTWAS